MKSMTRSGFVGATLLALVLGAHGSVHAATDPQSVSQESYLGTNSTQTFQAHSLTTGTDSTTGQPIVIAIIGEGVDAAFVSGQAVGHDDLKSKLWYNLAEKNGVAGVDDDANGKVDDISGWDFIASPDDNDPRPQGTPAVPAAATGMAGIAAAATGNGIGISAVCPDCQILNIRAATSLSPQAPTVAEVNHSLTDAISYAAEMIKTTAHKKGVILIASVPPRELGLANGYLGVHGPLQTLLDQLFDQEGPYAGTTITVVAPAGNNMSDEPDYPCAYDDPDSGEESRQLVLCVGATDTNPDTKDMRSVFSNFGEWVLVGAPGQNIRATLPGNQYGFLSFSAPSRGVPMVSGNESGSETSASAAIVAGQVGLLLAELDALETQLAMSLGPKDVQEIVRFDVYRADQLPPGEAITQMTFDLELGSGRVNALTAVQDALGVLAASTGASSAKGPVALLSFPETNRPVSPGENLPIRGSVLGHAYTLTLYTNTCSFCNPIRWDNSSARQVYTQSSASLIDLADPASPLLPVPGTWTVPADLPEGDYSLELRVTRNDTGREAVSIRRVLVERSYEPGWPRFVNDNFYHGANLADLDGNGTLEILVGSSKAGKQGVYVFNAAGTQLLHLRTCNPAFPNACGRVFSTPAVGDVTGDGLPDIVATADASGSPSVFAWDRNGALLFTKSVGNIKSSPALGRTSAASNKKDIFVTRKNGFMLRLDGTGAILGGGRLCNACADPLMESSPLLPDLEYDGVVEVIVPSQEALTTYGFRSNVDADADTLLDPLPNFPLAPMGAAPGLIFDASAGDFNFDGTLDLVVPQVRQAADDTQLVLVDSSTGQMLKTFNAGSQELFMYVGAASADLGTFADTDGDGKPEYVSAAKDSKLETAIVGMSGRVYLLDHELRQINVPTGNICHDGRAGQWPNRMLGRGAGSPVIADLDYDGVPEVITTGSDKAMYAWTPTGCLKSTLNDGAGGTLYGFPRGLKAPACVNPFPTKSPLKRWAIEDISRCAAPAVGDVDNDGKLELVAVAGSGVTGENGIYVWQLSPTAAPAATTSAAVLWGVYGQNPDMTRTAAASRRVSVGGVIYGHTISTNQTVRLSGATVKIWRNAVRECQTTTASNGWYDCSVPCDDGNDIYTLEGYHAAYGSNSRSIYSVQQCNVTAPNDTSENLTLTRCFIATAAYGSALAPEIGVLRAYRDTILSRSSLGRAFTEAYYELSPPLARFIEEKPLLRALVRAFLKPIVQYCRGQLNVPVERID